MYAMWLQEVKMHRKDLISQGYKSVDTCSGPVRLRNKGAKLKSQGKVKAYRVVKYSKGYELYVKK